MKKLNSISSFLFLISVLAGVASLTGCENFMDGDNLKNQLEDVVQENKAASMIVRIGLSKEDSGTTVPAESDYSYKVGKTFTVEFNISSLYTFTGWKIINKNTRLEDKSKAIVLVSSKETVSGASRQYIASFKINSFATDLMIVPGCYLTDDVTAPKLYKENMEDAGIYIARNKSEYDAKTIIESKEWENEDSWTDQDYLKKHVSSIYVSMKIDEADSEIKNVRVHETHLADISGKPVMSEKDGFIEDGFVPAGEGLYELNCTYNFATQTATAIDSDGIFKLDFYIMDSKENESPVVATCYVLKDSFIEKNVECGNYVSKGQLDGFSSDDGDISTVEGQDFYRNAYRMITLKSDDDVFWKGKNTYSSEIKASVFLGKDESSFEESEKKTGYYELPEITWNTESLVKAVFEDDGGNQYVKTVTLPARPVVIARCAREYENDWLWLENIPSGVKAYYGALRADGTTTDMSLGNYGSQRGVVVHPDSLFQMVYCLSEENELYGPANHDFLNLERLVLSDAYVPEITTAQRTLADNLFKVDITYNQVPGYRYFYDVQKYEGALEAYVNGYSSTELPLKIYEDGEYYAVLFAVKDGKLYKSAEYNLGDETIPLPVSVNEFDSSKYSFRLLNAYKDVDAFRGLYAFSRTHYQHSSFKQAREAKIYYAQSNDLWGGNVTPHALSAVKEMNYFYSKGTASWGGIFDFKIPYDYFEEGNYILYCEFEDLGEEVYPMGILHVQSMEKPTITKVGNNYYAKLKEKTVDNFIAYYQKFSDGAWENCNMYANKEPSSGSFNIASSEKSSDKHKFIRVVNYGYREPEDPKYVTTAKWNGSYYVMSDIYDEAISAPTYFYVSEAPVECNSAGIIETKFKTVILCDNPTFVHTLRARKNYGDDIDKWERNSEETSCRVIDPAVTGTNYNNYEPDVSNPGENKYYVVVAHFADGTYDMGTIKEF